MIKVMAALHALPQVHSPSAQLPERHSADMAQDAPMPFRHPGQGTVGVGVIVGVSVAVLVTVVVGVAFEHRSSIRKLSMQTGRPIRANPYCVKTDVVDAVRRA